MTPTPDTASASVVRPLIAAAFPDLAPKRPKLVCAGDEHDTWAVGDMVVKFPKSPEQATRLETERAVHPLLVERLGGVVPAIHVGGPVAGFPFALTAFERAAGRQGQAHDGPILQPKPWARSALAREVAGLLSALHTAPVKRAKALGVPPWPAKIEPGFEVGEAAVDRASRVAGDAVDGFLVDPIPSGSRELGKAVLCHGDLKGEHVFVSEDGTRVTALIDWADVVVADPAVDLAGLVIWLGPSFVREVLSAYTGPTDDGTFDRAVFLARSGLLRVLEAQLDGRAAVTAPLLEAQLRVAFSD